MATRHCTGLLRTPCTQAIHSTPNYLLCKVTSSAEYEDYLISINNKSHFLHGTCLGYKSGEWHTTFGTYNTGNNNHNRCYIT